jgi:ammonia channel protein AmtB
MWSTSGWISPYNTENAFLNLGAIDYAGDCAVHMVGGFSGLAAAYFIGYRGQFAKSDKFVARFEKTADGKWVRKRKVSFFFLNKKRL